MAFKYYKGMNGGSATNGEMTVEFKEWLKHFHENKDGRMSWEEVREALHYGGSWFQAVWRMRKRRAADENGDGIVEVHEIEELIEVARKHLGY